MAIPFSIALIIKALVIDARVVSIIIVEISQSGRLLFVSAVIIRLPFEYDKCACVLMKMVFQPLINRWSIKDSPRAGFRFCQIMPRYLSFCIGPYCNRRANEERAKDPSSKSCAQHSFLRRQ